MPSARIIRKDRRYLGEGKGSNFLESRLTRRRFDGDVVDQGVHGQRSQRLSENKGGETINTRQIIATQSMTWQYVKLEVN